MWGADWLLQHERDAVYADYVLTESGGFQIPTPAGRASRCMVGEKGTFWSKITRARHAGPRLAAVPHRQRAGHRGRGRAPHRRVPARRRRSTSRGAASSRDSHSSPSSPTALLDPEKFDDALAELPLGLARHWPRVHAHHVRADGRARRHEDQRDPRPASSSRSTSARCRVRSGDGRDASCCARRSATSPTRSRSSRTTTRRPRRRSTRRCGTRSRASSAALCEGSALVPSLMVGGTDNRFFRRAGSVGYGFGLFSQRLALRGLRHDVPRQRRAGRPGVAGAVDAALGSRGARPRRLGRATATRHRRGRGPRLPDPAHTRNSIATSIAGPTPRWKRAAVDAPGGGDRADQVEGEQQRGGARAEPDDEQDPADELERADQVGGDLGRAGCP